MRNNIRIFFSFFTISVLVITGCLSNKTMSGNGEIQYYRPPALSNEILNSRIANIKKMLEENSLSEDRKETAISILKAYDKLKSLNKENSTEKEYRKTVKLLFDTLLPLEEQYFLNGIVSEDSGGEMVIENYSSLKKEIYEDYVSGDLEGVIAGCEEVISRFGRSGLTPDIGIMLVEALSKYNMTSDALFLAKSILGAVENKPDLIRLLADTIEMEAKAGNMDNAKALYEKLVDNINDRNNIFQKSKNLLSKYQSDGSIFDESVTEKINEIDPEKSIQIKQLVNKVEDLISNKDFSGARLELLKRRIRAEEGPELDMIEQLQKSVDRAEEQFAAENSNDRLILDDARRLVEEEKYEKALDLLEPVVSAGGNYEAEKIKKEAIEKLINREKLNAAKLKILADKESDIQRKRGLLLEVRSIFQNLIDKYSVSPLIDRVKRNISVVDEELMKLPPTNE